MLGVCIYGVQFLFVSHNHSGMSRLKYASLLYITRKINKTSDTGLHDNVKKVEGTAGHTRNITVCIELIKILGLESRPHHF
jgi:hypothetical protein